MLRSCQQCGVRLKIWLKQSWIWSLLNIVLHKFQHIIYSCNSSYTWNFRAFRAAGRNIQKKEWISVTMDHLKSVGFQSPPRKLIQRAHWCTKLSKQRYSRLHESAWRSVTKVLKLPTFGTCTLGFLPTQPPTYLLPNGHFRELLHILPHRPQKSDLKKVPPMFLYSWIGQNFETPSEW